MAERSQEGLDKPDGQANAFVGPRGGGRGGKDGGKKGGKDGGKKGQQQTPPVGGGKKDGGKKGGAGRGIGQQQQYVNFLVRLSCLSLWTKPILYPKLLTKDVCQH